MVFEWTSSVCVTEFKLKLFNDTFKIMKTWLKKLKTLWFVLIGLILITTTIFSGNINKLGPVLSRAETLKISAATESRKVSSPGKGLLLFAYMRSGSTVTGYLLRDSPGVFYMFEPLSPLAPYEYFTDTSFCRMSDERCSSKDVKAQIEEAILTLVNLYSCNMRGVPMPVLDKMVQEKKSGPSWLAFGNCLNNTKPRDIITRSICFDRLEEECRAADIRVAKVLRLGFATIQTLLENLPDLKILFLARDPRAIINSRIKTTWFPVSGEKPETVLSNTLSLCQKMKTDIIAWKKTNILYGDRILHTTLTKIASRINAMLDIYKFMNKTVTLTVERNMKGYLSKNLRNNITELWRSELALSYRKHVEKHCWYVIQHVATIDET